ncbi:MAG TPA: hypothetical protein PLO53_02120 [Candidatus Hydrogenedentes bacterium]|nr:hypothetical protein [Candidatus Hydrogenedentota bacterium]
MHRHTLAAFLIGISAVMLTAAGQEVPPAGNPPRPPDGPHVQPGKPDRPVRDSRPAQERNRRNGKMLEQVMLARLSEELELSDEQTVLLVRRFMDFRNRRGELRKEREQLMRAMQEAIEKNEPDAKVEELLNRIRDLHEQTVNLMRTLYEELSKELNIRQRAKLFLFLERFDAEVQQMLKRAADRMGNQPGRPGPVPGGPHPPMPGFPDGQPVPPQGGFPPPPPPPQPGPEMPR